MSLFLQSDSVENGQKEIALWFPEGLNQYKLASEVSGNRLGRHIHARARSLLFSLSPRTSLLTDMGLRVKSTHVIDVTLCAPFDVKYQKDLSTYALLRASCLSSFREFVKNCKQAWSRMCFADTGGVFKLSMKLITPMSSRRQSRVRASSMDDCRGGGLGGRTRTAR